MNGAAERCISAVRSGRAGVCVAEVVAPDLGDTSVRTNVSRRVQQIEHYLWNGLPGGAAVEVSRVLERRQQREG